MFFQLAQGYALYKLKIFIYLYNCFNTVNLMEMVKIAVFILCFFFCSVLNAQEIIPTPKEIRSTGKHKTHVTLIDAKVVPQMKLPLEGYTLTIKGKKATLRAKTKQGLVWAHSTLKQLKGKDGLYPEVYIKDYPAFELRGFMHDTGRNFRPIEILKKELDLFSLYKINTFHWHLTDNPAWRIECRAYPELNNPANHRPGRDEGKFYSYQEIHELIAYAKERGIQIIPEIDMPGHSQYFKTTFGCDMASEKGKQILKVCLEEFFGEITKEECPYFHIGSDEVHVENPEDFMHFCEQIVLANGRVPICWNPGLPSSMQTINQIWSAPIGNTTAKNTSFAQPYIDSYQGYLNTGHPILNTSKYFLHQVCGVSSGNTRAIGSILCLWNDVRVDDKEILYAHNGMPNGLLSFAERTWCGGDGENGDDENLLPPVGSQQHADLVKFEKKIADHRDRLLYDWDMRWVANASLEWEVTLPEARGTSRDSMEWKPAWGGVIDMIAFCKKHDVKLLPTMDAWMKTEIFCEKDTVINAWVGFDTPSRSSRMSDGIGYQGYWEAQGRVFVNNNEVFPKSAWKEPGKYRCFMHSWHKPAEEIPYTNEQFCWMREPAELSLKKGWNSITLYCPRVFPNDNWFVTFIPVTIDGNGHVSEVEGIFLRSTH